MLPCLIVATDAFRVGGRETFLLTYLSEIKRRHKIKLVLMARAVSADAPSRIFDEVHIVAGEGAEEICSWVSLTATVLARHRSALIWAQHFGMLPAWLVASKYRQPLLATFHGPVDSIARPNLFLDAVGMALALHRLPFTTAVSEEVAASLVSVGKSSCDVRIVPNRVLVPTSRRGTFGRSPDRLTRMVMLARPTKLGHIRAAVDFLACWCRLEGRASLRIVNPGSKSSEIATQIDRIVDTAKRLGRKWVASKFSRMKNLGKVAFIPATQDPYSEIRDCDVVLGMGRTVLEGMALAKPTVLIGYDSVIDLVTCENFHELRRSNFSGRGVAPTPEDFIVRKTARCLATGYQMPESVIAEIDAAAHWGYMAALLEAAAQICPRPGDEDVADNLIEILSAALQGENIRDAILAALPNPERETIELLWSPGQD